MRKDSHMGGCSCGRLRYRLHAKPLIVHACHCRMCQRLTGSTNAVNVLIEAEKVQLLSGETCNTHALTPSGHGQTITRCKTCQVAVWSEYLVFSKRSGTPVLFIRAGTLDQPDQFPPDVHIFADSMQPHVNTDDSTPKFPAFYSMKDVWSKDSLNRLLLAAAS